MNISWAPVFKFIDINEAFSYYYFTIIDAYNKFFSLCPKSKKAIKNKLWLTPLVKQLSVNKNNLYKKWLSTMPDEDLIAYKGSKSIYEKTSEEAKNQYYNNIFACHRTSKATAWKELNKLCRPNNNSTSTSIPYILIDNNKVTDPQATTNNFNSYFSNIAFDLLSNIPPAAGSFSDHLQAPLVNSFYFQDITDDEVSD